MGSAGTHKSNPHLHRVRRYDIVIVFGQAAARRSAVGNAQAAWNRDQAVYPAMYYLLTTLSLHLFSMTTIFFVSCTTVKHDWRRANKQTTQNNATAFWKMLIIVLLDNHSDVVGWQLASRILEKSVLATPHVCTFCLNGTTHLWEGLCVVIVFSRSQKYGQEFKK